MRLRLIIPAVAFNLASWVAHAQPIQGIYIGGGAGGLLPFPPKNTAYAAGISGDFNIKQKLGLDTELSVGYALGNGWRFELEGSYGRATVRGFSDTSFPAAGSGAVRDWGVMANALFDLDVGSPYIYPYLGLGAGYQSTRLDGFSLTGVSKPVTFSASGDAGGFAVQAIGGLSFPIPNMPGLSLTVDYRIMDILAGEKFNGVTSFGSGSAPIPGTTKFHNQFDQIVMFGVRYAFNTPPPAPGAGTNSAADTTPPPTAQARTYLVSFDTNRANLNDRAQGIVRQAAMAVIGRQPARIEVNGNTVASDRSPPDPALSDRRAKAVAAALIGDGVPKGAITILARGDIGPAASTTSGAADRRVEIVTE